MIINACHSKSNGSFASGVGRGMALGASWSIGSAIPYILLPLGLLVVCGILAGGMIGFLVLPIIAFLKIFFYYINPKHWKKKQDEI